MYKLCILPIVFWMLSSCKENENPDLIVYNAVVYTADSIKPMVEAFSVKDGRILETGHYEGIIKLKGAKTLLVDAQGRFIMPGLHEGHGHFLSLGSSLMNIDLLDIKSWEELVHKVKLSLDTVPPGIWIEGRGWHQDKWHSKLLQTFNGYPYHDELSKISPNHPIVLYHASGHALLANQKAMELAGIGAETQAPSGGRIVRDPNGKLTGIFEENAMDIIAKSLEDSKKNLPDSVSFKLKETKLNLACNEAIKYGITSFQDAGTSYEDLVWLHEMSRKGLIPIRLNLMLYEDIATIFNKIDSMPIQSYNENMFKSRAVKAYMDGALGSYGAWLWDDYTDNPGVKGQTLVSVEKLDALAAKAKQSDLQLCVHAIGDRANHEVLQIFKKNAVQTSDRWRIEHAQHLDTADLPLFKELGVIASMQAIHCISDAPFVEKRLGKQRAQSGAYIWRSLLNKGIHFANGTDVPVERINPFDCIYASVTRKRIDSGYEFYAEQKLTRDEALKSYTIWNAYASFDEKEKGSITPGKFADFIIINRNLLTCTDEEILNTKVEAVYINGSRIK